jgi:hypothetical protein
MAEMICDCRVENVSRMIVRFGLKNKIKEINDGNKEINI